MRAINIGAALSGVLALGMLVAAAHPLRAVLEAVDLDRIELAAFVQMGAACAGLAVANRTGGLNMIAGALILASIITPLFGALVQRSALSGVDQALGFLFGVARGVLLIAVAFLVYNRMVADAAVPAVDDSRSAQVFAALVAVLERVPRTADAEITDPRARPPRLLVLVFLLLLILVFLVVLLLGFVLLVLLILILILVVVLLLFSPGMMIPLCILLRPIPTLSLSTYSTTDSFSANTTGVFRGTEEVGGA